MTSGYPEADEIFLAFRDYIRNPGEYPPSGVFERFMDFALQRLPSQEGEALRKEWGEKREELVGIALKLFPEEMEENEKELIGFLLCNLAQVELPEQWDAFEARLAMLH